jgi:hypothetical protein
MCTIGAYETTRKSGTRGGILRPNPLEALDAGFFPLERLPEPLHGREHRWIRLAHEFHFAGRVDAYFDPL